MKWFFLFFLLNFVSENLYTDIPVGKILLLLLLDTQY